MLDQGTTMGLNLDLKGRSALVTGASSGLGVTFARGLAAAGANVVLVARRADRLEQLAAEIQSAGVQSLALPCDVGDAAAVAAMVSAAWARFGRIDILVNGAGVAAEGAVVPEKVPPELFEQTMRVNVTGTFYCCREVAALMLADGKGGSIINIASISGMAGTANFPVAYQASKAAVINLTRALACSWADRGVRVNALAPGWFPSEMTESLFAIPPFMEWACAAAPMKRVGNPEELIGALLFLATNASSFVTGHTLVVDGGLSAASSGGGLPPAVTQIFEQAVPGGLGKRIVSR
jgi:NAD(P)-dependent dehydrogenase (short-subunit alcohol dehydrogenase family)